MVINFDQQVHALTTMIIVQKGNVSMSGSGFFYSSYRPIDNSNRDEEPDKVWLVTNRHVVLPKLKGPTGEIENEPDNLVFYLRAVDGDKLRWDPIELNIIALRDRVRVHSNKNIDVAIIEVKDLIGKRMDSEGNSGFVSIFCITKDQLPSSSSPQPSLADDALVIGYPRGFFDEFNLYPIVKSGIIASGWGYNFNGLPSFLIDAKLFPGSSGSLVISKPLNFAVINGMPKYSKEKKYLFLGVFSGEPMITETSLDLEDITIVRRSGMNTGLVWYGKLVEEIINNGRSLIEAKK